MQAKEVLLKRANRKLRSRIIGTFAFLALVNIAAWIWAFVVFRASPVLLGTTFIAYSFGLRHAVDADHITAIDNATRKLMQEGKQPLLVGLFFSLGHSTVVVIAAFVVFLSATALENQFAQWKQIGAIVGTSVSAVFLFVIAGMNILIFRGVYQTFRQVKNGAALSNQNLDTLLERSGIFGRAFHPIFRMLSESWHMFPIGFLFGLGFDTATEVALLGIAASAGARGLSASSMMVFPALFTAGMILVDTTDGILMLGAYGWAFLKPVRKLYYNMTITLVSVGVALLVGGIEVIGLLKDQLNLQGGVWDLVGNVSGNFGSLGFLIIGVFLVGWAASVLFYRLKGFDNLE